MIVILQRRWQEPVNIPHREKSGLTKIQLVRMLVHVVVADKVTAITNSFVERQNTVEDDHSITQVIQAKQERLSNRAS